ncbi:hypothetical protein ABZX75_26310 [Streptomyces sp. NPDC003038]|uniref:hypothetical protein n=1 Tax=unclassified Streptomyces TaxID=2593676 RepID=UPI0033BCAE90
MKILASSTLAVAALLLAAVPASADDTPGANKGAIGQGSSSLGFGADGTDGDSGGGHASSNRHLVKTGDPGALSDLVNNLSNPQPQ